jgi:hypothetical protein
MTPKSNIGHIACVICGVWAICLGCSSTDPQYDIPGITPSAMPQRTVAGREQVEILLAQLSRLHAVSQEALEAAAAIGTTDQELSPAQQALALAQQAQQAGHQAYMAGHYQVSWEKLQTAESAFRHAEEHAMRAGLDHIERELAQTYAHLPPAKTQRAGVRSDSVQVIEGVVNLRDGAGVDYQVVGRVRIGQRLHILAEVGEWYRVRTEQGRVGWVSKEMVVRLR